jgi:hypothetical protein
MRWLMSDLIAELQEALAAEKRKSLEQYRSVRAEARSALRMIREVMEMHAPSGSVLPEERVEPPLTAEAEVLVAGILAIVGASSCARASL